MNNFESIPRVIQAQLAWSIVTGTIAPIRISCVLDWRQQIAKTGGTSSEWSLAKAFECLADREKEVTVHGISVGDFYASWFRGDYPISCANRLFTSKTDSDRLRQGASGGGSVPKPA